MTHDDYAIIMKRVKDFLPYDQPKTKAELIEQLECLQDEMKENFGIYFHRQKLNLDPMLYF